MKILLFNLGSIDHRILAWGVDGFHSIFKQDVILWGPIPDEKFVFKGKEIPILKISEQTTIEAVFKKLPKDWYPDIVTCDTSVLNYVPDIFLCPVKTLLFARDSWSDTVFNRGLVEFFDFVNSSTIDRSLYRDFHVSLLPLSGFAVSTPGPDAPISEFEERNIDVIAIANYDSSFYHERHKVFYNLSALNRTGININYVRSISRSEIYGYYQRSKIVLDWAHTLSNRSYEAALNGCLLFSHEDNKVMNDFWTPWEEYIPYNEKNLSQLITQYLDNPDRSKTVINNARRKVKSMPENWGEMAWEKINLVYQKDVSIQDRIEHNRSLPYASQYYRTATPLLYNYDYNTGFPSNWKDLYFQRIENAISGSENQKVRIAPIIEAARVAFLLGRHDFSLRYLNELQNLLPDYAWTHYLLGRIYFERGEYDLALLSLQEALQCALKAPELIQEHILPVIEKGNTCDARRITSFMWQSALNHNNEFQVKALKNLALELSGEIFRRTGKQAEAIKYYLEAINNVSIPDCIYKLSPLLIQSGAFDLLAETTAKGVEDSPYDSIVVFYYAYALIQLKQKREAIKVLSFHQKALKSFVGIRLITLIRISIYILLTFVIFGRQPASAAILEMIKILKKKSEVSYLFKKETI
jgi:tetratricopeptide (TPR) repeat protein